MAIFIQAPSSEELRKRLQGRGSETEESLQARINKSSYEMTFKKHFENVITNKDFQTACLDAEKIVCAFLDKLI